MRGGKRSSLTVALGLLMALLAILPGGLARGEKPDGGEISAAQAPIMQYVRVTDNFVNDGGSAVAYNSVRQEFLVVWTQLIDDDNWHIYAQRISSAGSLLGSAIAIDTSGQNSAPDVAYDAWNDRYLVVYDYAYSSVDHDIYGRVVQGDGTLPYLIQAIDTSITSQSSPCVAYNSQDHEYLVVYQSETTAGSQLDTIVGRRVASDGTLVGTAPTTIASTVTRFPDVAYNSTLNQYLVVYQRLQSGGDRDIQAHRVANNLGLVGSEFGVCTDSYAQVAPAVAAGRNEYLVVWEDSEPGHAADYNAFGRRVLGNGTPQGAAGGFFIGVGSEDIWDVVPAVAYAGPYGYLVSWVYMEGSGTVDWHWDVYGAYVLGGTDQRAGSSFGIDTYSADQDLPAVACAPNGDCLVTENDAYFAGDLEISGWFVRLHRIYVPLTLRNAP
jgi:hypothetical protein